MTDPPNQVDKLCAYVLCAYMLCAYAYMCRTVHAYTCMYRYAYMYMYMYIHMHASVQWMSYHNML